MNVKELKEQVIALFQKNDIPLKLEEETKTELAEAETADGTIIYTSAEEWAEGVDVFIMNEEGEQIPLPEGEYPLADGRVVNVAEVGVVASITEGEAEPEMSSEPSIKDVLSFVQERIEALKGEFSKEKTDLETKVAKLSKDIEAKDKEINELKLSASELPKGEPIKEKVEPIDLSKLNPQERVNALLNTK